MCSGKEMVFHQLCPGPCIQEWAWTDSRGPAILKIFTNNMQMTHDMLPAYQQMIFVDMDQSMLADRTLHHSKSSALG